MARRGGAGRGAQGREESGARGGQRTEEAEETKEHRLQRAIDVSVQSIYVSVFCCVCFSLFLVSSPVPFVSLLVCGSASAERRARQQCWRFNRLNRGSEIRLNRTGHGSGRPVEPYVNRDGRRS